MPAIPKEKTTPTTTTTTEIIVALKDLKNK